MADASTDATASEPEQHDQHGAPSAPEGAPPAEIDIQALAEKVYRLMMAEIRLDRARGQPAPEGT